MTNTSPLVSIIIPVYNGSNYLKEAIDSALAQTYKNIEIIVVNDGSADEGKTEKIANSYGKKIRYFSKPNGGVASALNFGIEKMNGDFFSWLSHDDLYLPEKVSLQIEALKNAPENAVAYSDFYEIDEKGKTTKKIKLPKSAEKHMRVLLALETEIYLQGCSLLIPKKLFKTHGNFDTTKATSQDYALWFAFAGNVPFVHVPKYLVKSRIHPAQDSHRYADTKKEETDTVKSYFLSELSKGEILGYNTDSKYYFPFFELYRDAGYEKIAKNLINKMHEAFGEKIRVSVIVPVYNVEKYLKKCLDSLIGQTFMPFEIIIVNDGSPDSSAEIAREYAESYPAWVKLYNKENGGLGDARNFGLKHAKGEYVGFVDSDDYIDPIMYEEMYKKIAEGCDLVMCGIHAIDEVRGETAWIYNFPTDIDYRDVSEVVKYCTVKLPPNAWNKLMLKSNHERFSFGLGFYEDVQSIPATISHANKIGIVDIPLYFYRVNRKGSIMSTKRADARNLAFIDGWETLMERMNPQYAKEMIFAIYQHVVDIVHAFPAFIDEYMEFFRRNIKTFEENPFVPDWVKSKEHDHRDRDLFNIKFIPKIIHYLWFGGGAHTELQELCMASWKRKAPGYKIICWNESNCDITENAYVEQAYKAKKWAFVSDYFRFKVLDEHGGFYFDVDVELHQHIDQLRFHRAFYAFEKQNVINGAIIGAIPGHSSVKRLLGSYNNDAFINEKGELNLAAIPIRITKVMHEYGVKLNGLKQTIKDNITIYPFNVMTVDIGDNQNIAEHHYEYSWGDTEPELPFKFYVTREYFVWQYLQGYETVPQQPQATYPIVQQSDYNINVQQLIQETSLLIGNIQSIYSGLLAQASLPQQQYALPVRRKPIRRFCVRVAKILFRPAKWLMTKLRLKPFITSTSLYKKLRGRGIMDKLNGAL